MPLRFEVFLSDPTCLIPHMGAKIIPATCRIHYHYQYAFLYLTLVWSFKVDQLSSNMILDLVLGPLPKPNTKQAVFADVDPFASGVGNP